MQIFILEIEPLLQPQTQSFQYPSHNKDYGIEQDFLIWLKKQKTLLTDNPAMADWHYLPVYWTRWHINHNFAANGEGLKDLRTLLHNVIIDDTKTFTITQFDGGTLLDLGKTVEFTAARTINAGIDVPILCSTHKIPPVPAKKRYLASFNGAFYTHPIREEMQARFGNDNRLNIGGSIPTRFYKRWLWAKNYNLNTMASYMALCPRGTSCNSFRFYEAMQFAVAPCLIGDVDVRPFKNFIPWNDISYYVQDIDELEILLNNLDKDEALKKGKLAYQYWKNDLYYQKWCKYIVKELDALN